MAYHAVLQYKIYHIFIAAVCEYPLPSDPLQNCRQSETAMQTIMPGMSAASPDVLGIF